MMEIRKLHADAPIVIITAYATVDTAITAMKEGALEYIVKPCNPQEISLLVDRIMNVKNLQRENRILRKKLNRQYHLQDVVGKSAAMQAVFERIQQAARLQNTVLVEGESGAGKELVARQSISPAIGRPGPSSASPAPDWRSHRSSRCSLAAETTLLQGPLCRIRGAWKEPPEELSFWTRSARVHPACSRNLRKF